MKHLLSCYASSTRLDLPSAELTWPEGASLLATAPAAQVTRVAYAVQRCTDGALLLNDEEDLEQDSWTLRRYQNPKIFDVSMWLPQLLALHHPAALILEPTTFLTVYRRISEARHENSPATQLQWDAEFVTAHFALCYLTLQRLATTHWSYDVVELFEKHFFPMMDVLDEHGEREPQAMEQTLREFEDGMPPPGTRQTSITQLEASSIILPMILRHCAQSNIHHTHNPFPKPSQLPFNTFMDVQPIYADFAEGFNKSHIRGMTSAEFLAGTWGGVYSDHRGMRRSTSFQARLDPPMHNIRLVTQRSVDGDAVSVVIDRSSRGVDAHGEFSLEGRILNTGAVHMVKRYIVHGWNWTWTGYVTPFGLVGIWGSAMRMGGYFWIWKEEWVSHQ